jgi:ABC-type glycerol-3-phosphate transport system permease component
MRSNFKTGKNINIVNKTLQQLLFILLSITAIFPLYYIFTTAFKGQQESVNNRFGLPIHFILDNFIVGLKDGKFLIWLMNSAIITVGAVLIATAISALAAFAFSRMKFPGRDIIFNIVVSLLMIPVVVIITPLFVFMSSMGLINNRFAAILIYVGILMPFSIYLLNNVFLTIPQSIMDAASIDGCSDFRVLWKIIFPISRPIFITLTIINCLYVWNELLIALVFLQNDSLKTLMVGISTYSGLYNVNVPVIMAGVLIATLPMIIIYIIGQRKFIEGMIAGSLAGQ